ncbi:MAG: hypothetical protein QOF45_220 [Gaiellaceae bacterium]|nr:hypothetical protein [Gaiellaceae bacterium]
MFPGVWTRPLQAILQASDRRPTIRSMVYALLVCSENDCTDEFEAWGTLEEVESLACDCGCALELMSVSDAEALRHEEPFVLARAA